MSIEIADIARVADQAEIIAGLPAVEYHRDKSRVSASDLQAIDVSPLQYRHQRSIEKKGDELDVGAATHMAIFEPNRFKHHVVVYDGKVRRGKYWEEFSASRCNNLILTPSQYNTVCRMSSAVRKHPIASRLIQGGNPEVTIHWVHRSGVRMKSRIDYLSPFSVVELKTTRDASEDAFGRACVRYRYPIQFAVYTDAVSCAFGEYRQMYVIAVEKLRPHHVAVYMVPIEIIMIGRERYERALRVLAECKKTDSWPGLAGDEIRVLQLPAWAIDDHEMELEFEGEHLRF